MDLHSAGIVSELDANAVAMIMEIRTGINALMPKTAMMPEFFVAGHLIRLIAWPFGGLFEG